MRLLPLILVALALAGCGGGEDRLSRPEFVREANDICAASAVDASAAGADSLTATVEKALQASEDRLAELRDLNPPEELEARVERWLDVEERKVELLRELRDAAKAIDERGEPAREEAARLTKALGLVRC